MAGLACLSIAACRARPRAGWRGQRVTGAEPACAQTNGQLESTTRPRTNLPGTARGLECRWGSTSRAHNARSSHSCYPSRKSSQQRTVLLFATTAIILSADPRSATYRSRLRGSFVLCRTGQGLRASRRENKNKETTRRKRTTEAGARRRGRTSRAKSARRTDGQVTCSRRCPKARRCRVASSRAR
jgi:hypothetical protein